MITYLENRFLYFYTKGHTRSRRAKKHISLSLIYRGIDLLISLALVTLVLNYLDKTRYGIWLVLFSLTTYFRFMNIGLEQGLRNKLAVSKAKGEIDKAKYYVSTTYATIGIISISFYSIFLFINQFLDWTKILNTSSGLRQELSLLAVFVFGSFSLSFILKIITTILIADQKPSIRNLKNTLEKIVKLFFILFAIFFVPSSLLVLGIGYSIIPVVILLAFNFYYFNKEYRDIRPSFKYVDFSYLKDLMGIGIKFFIISIAVIVLYTTDNMIITQLYGPDQVTPYQIAHRFFSIPLMLFMIVIQPLWSAVTEAFQKKDMGWIKNYMKNMIRVWYWFVLAIGVMLLFSPIFYKIWLHNKISIPITISFGWALFAIVMTYSSIYTYFINGVGKLKVQLITSINSIIINIPLSIFLAKYLKLGSVGVILATVICISIGGIVKRIHYNKIIANKAIGIWNE